MLFPSEGLAFPFRPCRSPYPLKWKPGKSPAMSPFREVLRTPRGTAPGEGSRAAAGAFPGWKGTGKSGLSSPDKSGNHYYI